MSIIIYFLLAGIVITSFISGVLSLGGGTILMGLMGWVLPVSVAMMLHGVTQMASNGSRSFIYRQHIYWPVLSNYFIGAVVCVGIFSWLAFVPNKAILFLLLGIMPFSNYLLPKNRALDITKRSHAISCGFIVSACLLTAGVSGPILDTYYVRSKLNRFQIHATKGITQAIGHLIKVVYFAFILNLWEEAVDILPLWVFGAVIPLAYVGVWAAKSVVNKMSDIQFRKATQFFNILIGLTFLVKSANLFLSGDF